MAGEVGAEQVRATLDFPGFAQEFLRRNPDYRRAYECVMPLAARGDATAREVMARGWGLCFPLSAAQGCA